MAHVQVIFSVPLPQIWSSGHKTFLIEIVKPRSCVYLGSGFSPALAACKTIPVSQSRAAEGTRSHLTLLALQSLPPFVHFVP